jgi:hypothetical protein
VDDEDAGALAGGGVVVGDIAFERCAFVVGVGDRFSDQRGVGGGRN